MWLRLKKALSLQSENRAAIISSILTRKLYSDEKDIPTIIAQEKK